MGNHKGLPLRDFGVYVGAGLVPAQYTQYIMKSNPPIHYRKSIRLKNYDYSMAGLYFITICTHERLPIFGNIVDGLMQLNDSGKIAHEEWQKTGSIRSNIVLHEFVIMPNHLHGIIQIVGAHCMRPDGMQPNSIHAGQKEHVQQGRMQCAPTVGDIIRGYKSAVTKGIKAFGSFSNHVIWQRNYYEHIIRNEAAYLKIADYIETNPQRWQEDTYYV
jgi:REP element-mobilizing transposase RayT